MCLWVVWTFLTILILLIYKHEIFFHLFMSTSFSFIRVFLLSVSTDILCPWINLDKTTVHALRSGELLLATGCTPLAVNLLAGLQVQVGLQGGCHSLAELLAMFWATSWALELPLVGQDHRLCFLALWCYWLDSAFRWGQRQSIELIQGLGLCCVTGWDHRLCPEVGQGHSPGLLLGRHWLYSPVIVMIMCGWNYKNSLFLTYPPLLIP